MARVDKTNSSVGVVRAPLAADAAEADHNKVIGVGLDAQGRVVKGAGQSGVIGVMVPDPYASLAGQPVDIFTLADIVEVEGLAAGSKIYAENTTGVVSATDTNGTLVGFTVEADRLIVRK